MKKFLILFSLIIWASFSFAADTKVSDLTALSEAPANGDLFIVVDVSDTTMASTGTTKKITASYLLNSLDGENIQDDTIDDDSIDFTDVTLNDFTFDVGSVSKTEFGYLDGITSAIQTQLGTKAALGANSDITSMTGLTTPLGAAYGGTGVANNAANTITFSGNYSLGLTLSGNTSLTFPTSGTLLATDGSGASLTDIPLDSDFSSNGIMERTGAGTYGIATAGTDYIDPSQRFTANITIQEFGNADTTPDVSAAATGINNFYYSNANGTITDFDDGDDHSEFSAGDWFVLRIDDASTVIDFSENANIEGNAGVDFTGSASQITYIIFVYEDSRWNAVNFQSGYSTPTNLAASSANIRPGFVTDASGDITVTAAQMNGVVYGTDGIGGYDVEIPDGFCDAAADVGNWLAVISSAADKYSLVSLDASNIFILPDLTNLTAGYELDIDGSQVCVMCIAAEYWKVTGYMGNAPTDGGAGD